MGMFAIPEGLLKLRRQRKYQVDALTALRYATRYRKNRKSEAASFRRQTSSEPSIWVKYGQPEKP